MDVSTVWDFCGELVGSIRPRNGYVPATVTRIDADGTVWVTTGDGMEAPASTCAAGVAVGDVVSVQWSGAQMGVVGNASDPAAGTSTVRAVRKAAESARKVASGARAIANAIGQHFFTDDNGVHVSSEKDNPTGERNILMNSLGILLRQGSAWLASFSDSAVAFYDGLGNAAANIVAQFGADGAVVGRSGESHMELDYHSLRMVDKGGIEYFHVSDLRDESGYATLTDAFVGDGTTTSFSLQFYAAFGTTVLVTVNDVEQLEGTDYELSSNRASVVFYSAPSGQIVVQYKTQSAGAKAFTFGERMTSLIGAQSVVIGSGSDASGYGSKAIGSGCLARGRGAIALGNSTRAYGECSHAQNYATTAGYENQTVIGKFNANDPNNAFEIGNGTDYTSGYRSNAFAVGWNGDLTYQGTLHGATWQTGTSGTTSGGVTTLPASGTYILVTGHNSTPALNGIWIVRTGGNAAFNIAGGGNVTVSVSGTTLTVTTTAGTVNVYYQLCGT